MQQNKSGAGDTTQAANRPQDRQGEQGYILVAVIVVLAILTILGTTALFKSSIEIKVSTASVESEKALAAANAGLSETFAYWAYNGTGQTEYQNFIDWIVQEPGASAPAIYVNMYPDALTSGGFPLGGTVAAVDTWVQGTAGVRVYNITSTGMAVTANANWGTGTDPQVAVWATTYDKMDAPSDYPYLRTKINYVTATECKTCRIVVYAVGRSGDARILLREEQAALTNVITNVAPLTNASAYTDFEDMYESECDETISTTPSSGISPTGVTDRVVIDVTQVAAGVVMASNDAAANGGKAFRDGAKSNPELTIDSRPDVVYDSATPTVAAVALDPGAPVPAGLVQAGLMGTDDEITYFTDAQSQLFNLNIYREAANTIRTGTTGYVPVAIDPGSGNYVTVSPGTDERTIDWVSGSAGPWNMKAGNNNVPRSGTLTIREFMYNVQRHIPMYGIVRVLIPVTFDPANDDFKNDPAMDCTLSGSATVITIRSYLPVPQGYAVLSAANVVAQTGGSNNDSSSLKDVNIAAVNGGTEESADILVYGAWFVDYFLDVNGNGLYDNASALINGKTETEHILSPLEAVDTYLKVELPTMINPALDGTAGYTATAGNIISSHGNYHGADADSSPDGKMDLMHTGTISTSIGVSATTIFDVAQNLRANPGGGTYFNANGDPLTAFWNVIASNGGAHTGTGTATLKNRLKYFYDTVKFSTGTDMSNFPNAFGDLATFYINNEASTDPEGSDAYHLIGPSGYVHGWKRAFYMYSQAGMTVTDWRDNLIAAASSWYSDRYDYLYVEQDGVNTKFLVNNKFADIPAQMYSGGLVDTHSDFNVSGVVYTSMQLELEAKTNKGRGGTQARQYVAGAMITGFGLYVQSKGPDTTVIIYDPSGMDNLHTSNIEQVMKRVNWQTLK